MRFAVLLMLLISAVSFEARQRRDCLSYEPSTVRLKGTILRKTFAGRPNYESVKKGDEPETYWIFHPAKPVCVAGDEPETNVRDIQLVFPDMKQYRRYASLLGKRVAVRGKLFHASTGHHHPNVLLEVASINLTSK